MHWALSPVSVLSLAFMWEFMSRQGLQYAKYQRLAIKGMARRRHAPCFYYGRMPEFEDEGCVWTEFFNKQIEARDAIRHAVVDWHLKDLQKAQDFSLIQVSMDNLFASLTLEGYTTDHLFRTICKYALDPLGLKDTSVESRLRKVLESYRDPQPSEYIAYTKLVPTGPVSNTLRYKWSDVRLHSVDEVIELGTITALIGDNLEPFIITRRAVISGIGELHRREAQDLFALLAQRHPGFSVFVMPVRSYFKLTAPDSAKKYYDVGYQRTELPITETGDASGAILFERATRDLFDAPHEAMRNLLVGAELRWRRPTRLETDEVLANAYRWSLRKRLSREFSSYLSRANALGKNPLVPQDSVLKKLSAWDWENEKDFANLLANLSELNIPDDALVLCRLREIVNWHNPVNSETLSPQSTWREINDLLALIRGVRNSATHFGSADHELYGMMLYLARVLFEAFTAAWERDALATRTVS